MYQDIRQVIALIKAAASEELLPRFSAAGQSIESQQKSDGSVVTEADLAMQNRLVTELQNIYPDAVPLSEEMTVDQQQAVLDADRPVWCLDPLDGTSNFAAGIPYFAVSLSLIHHHKVILGIVYDPIRDECFFADENTDAHLNQQALNLSSSTTELKRAIAIIDFKRLRQGLAAQLATEQPFASQRNFGASALDWCWLAAKRGHVYLHGKQNIWDYSAGQYIFEKAGGLSCTLEGEALFINKLVGRSAVAAINPQLMQSWKTWLGIN